MSSYKKELTALGYLKARDQLLLEIASEFYKLSISKYTLEILQRQSELLNTQFRAVSAEFHQGLRTQKDYFRFQTQVNRSEIELVQARTDVQRAQLEMTRILGVPLTNSETIEFDIPSRVFNFVKQDPTLDLTIPHRTPELLNHYDYRLALLERNINDAKADQTMKQRWPEIFISSEVQYGSKGYVGTGKSIADNAAWNWNALVTLKYNFWDFGIRRRNAEIAQQETLAAQNRIEQELNRTKNQLGQLMINLEKQVTHYNLCQTLLRAERKSLTLLESEYRNGKVAYLDYITALKDFSDAEIKWITSYYQLQEIILEYQYHQGTLYDYVSKI